MQPARRRRLGVEEHRYGTVLVLTIAVLTFVVAAPETDWARAVAVLLQGATLFAVTVTSGARPEVRRLAASLVVLTVLVTVIGVVVGDFPNAVAQLTSGALAAAAPAVIIAGLLRLLAERGVTLQAVAAALTIYLLLGLLFAFAVGAIAEAGGASYFEQGTDGTQSERVYFSFTTLTTTGFGDLTAATQAGHAIAVLEMLIGQVYLVTVIAVLVSRLGHGPQTSPARRSE